MSEVGFRTDGTKSSGSDSNVKTPQSPSLLIDFDSDFMPAPPVNPSSPEKPVNGDRAPLPPRPTITKTSPISPGSIVFSLFMISRDL
jgi:hypothetical protein